MICILTECRGLDVSHITNKYRYRFIYIEVTYLYKVWYNVNLLVVILSIKI